ncbi:MAG: hypothetical protein EP323_00290 [Gammaproteobacteria bacterium]|nr:MAG: hypothetical protein EP323_00290 [Gammaproteobacteria bacterium]
MKRIDLEQGSFEWHSLRHGKLTGTTLKSALGSKKVQDTLLYKLVSERMTEPQIDEINSQSIARGRELEPIARKAVIEKTGLHFVETGMLISEEIPDFGLSPDGIYEESGKIVGGLEIKCPDSKKHIEYLIQGGVPSEYADQVKAPFLISDDIQWWIFASFDDRNYERPLHIVRVRRSDIKTIEEDRKKLADFMKRVDDEHANLTF